MEKLCPRKDINLKIGLLNPGASDLDNNFFENIPTNKALVLRIKFCRFPS